MLIQGGLIPRPLFSGGFMSSEFLYGRRATYEVLRAGKRNIRRIFTTKGTDDSEGIQAFLTQAQEQKVPVERVHRNRLDDLTGGANHQGVVIETSPYQYAALSSALEYAQNSGQPPLLLLLDLIQDVQNVGTLLRTADAVGVHGVIIQEKRAASITPAVVNASSGAVEHLNIIQVTNIVRTIKDLKQEDIWFAGLDMNNRAERYDQANLKGSLGLVVGSEGKGLRRLVRETCDFIIYLPMQGQVASLNAATAGSIALYAAWQARGFAGME